MTTPVENSTNQQGKGRGYVFLAASCWAMMSVSLINAGYALLLPRMAVELNWSDRMSGVFLGAMFGGMTGALLIAGTIVDRAGLGLPFFLGVLLQFVGAAAIGYFPSTGVAMAGIVLANMGSGTVMAAAIPAGCAMFSRHRTAICGFLNSFCGVGTVVVGVLVLLLMDRVFDWREMALLFAFLVVPAVVGSFFAPSWPAGSETKSARKLPLHLLADSAYLRLLAAIFLATLTALAVTLWLPVYVARLTAGGITGGAWGMVFIALTGTLGLLSCAALVERMGPAKLAVVSGVFATGFLMAASATDSVPWVVAGFTLFCLVESWLNTIIVGYAGDRFPREGASMFSILNGGANFGGVVGPVAFGIVAGAFGQGWAVRLAAALPAAALLLVLSVLWSRGPRRATVAAEPDIVTTFVKEKQ